MQARRFEAIYEQVSSLSACWHGIIAMSGARNAMKLAYDILDNAAHFPLGLVPVEICCKSWYPVYLSQC